MKTSETIQKISAALLIAQVKTGAAKKGNTNPFFKSKYADLGSVMEVCKDAMNEAEITVLQPIVSDGQNTYVETILIHSSGEYLSSMQQIVCAKQNDPQAQGSAITYARRYSLQSFLFIPTEDDDANLAMPIPEKPRTVEKRLTSLHSEMILKEINNREVDRDKLLKFYGAKSVYDLLEEKFDEIMTALKTKPMKEGI